MIQVQFLLESMAECEDIDHDLEFVGINSDDIHYLSKNSQEFAGHNVHQASLFEERDILHSGLQGAIIGLIVGILLSILIKILQPLGWQAQWYNFVFITVLSTGFSTWLGGLIGIGYENYKITDFHQYLIKGKTLLMVYLRPTDEQKVLKMMSAKHPDVRYLATKEALDNPFNSAKLVEYD